MPPTTTKKKRDLQYILTGIPKKKQILNEPHSQIQQIVKYRVFVAVARLLEGAGTHPIAAFTMCQVHETWRRPVQLRSGIGRHAKGTV